MPVTATLLPNAKAIHVVFTGVIEPGALRTALETVYAHPQYIKGMPEIGDFRAVTEMNVGFDDMHTFVTAFTKHHASNDTPLELFLLDQNPVGFSIADMFMPLSGSMDAAVNVHVVAGYPEIFARLNLSFDDLSDFPANCLEEADLL